ncbi:TPA: class I SAM-dependent methyltransferase [Burkholderia vietnamiensis]|nr:class I SAM-dependent methyltransferase [Burkholderia vietnamiensis]
MEDTYASTKRFYDVNAESYAEVTRALPISDEFASFIAQLPRGLKIVDLGCGAGRDLSAFSQRRVAAVGLDFSRRLAKLAQDYSACPVVVGDLRALPFATSALGGAWASASLLHLQRSDIDLALAEIWRVLVPAGVFFSSLKGGQGEETDTNGRWFSYFDQSDWLACLHNAGFVVTEMRTSVQESGTIEKDRSVSWFSCIAKKTGKHKD